MASGVHTHTRLHESDFKKSGTHLVQKCAIEIVNPLTHTLFKIIMKLCIFAFVHMQTLRQVLVTSQILHAFNID